MKRKVVGAALLGLMAIPVAFTVAVASRGPLTGAERARAIADAQVVSEAMYGTPDQASAREYRSREEAPRNPQARLPA